MLSTHIVADHFPPRFPRFYSNQQYSHSFSWLSTRDLSCEVVEVNDSLEIFFHTIHTLLTLGLNLCASCLYGNSFLFSSKYNNYIPDKK